MRIAAVIQKELFAMEMVPHTHSALKTNDDFGPAAGVLSKHLGSRRKATSEEAQTLIEQ